VDLHAAKKYGIPVTNMPGVNHVAVAEHTFIFLLAHYKNFNNEVSFLINKQWKRLVGHEIMGKKIAVLGLGRIGKEFALRARAFGLDVWAYDMQYDDSFISAHQINSLNRMDDIDDSFDAITLHLPLTSQTENLVDEKFLKRLKNKILIINTGRAGLIQKSDLEIFLQTNTSAAYYCDVLWEEPITENETLLKYPNVFITPHIGSRTCEIVERQGSKSVENLISGFSEVKDI